MTHLFWPHRLSELMDELELSNRGFATAIEPDDEKKRDSLRTLISGHRNGKQMKRETAERYAEALSEVAGRTITADDLLIVPEPPRTEEQVRQELAHVDRLLEGVAALSERLDALERLPDNVARLEALLSSLEDLLGGRRAEAGTAEANCG